MCKCKQRVHIHTGYETQHARTFHIMIEFVSALICGLVTSMVFGLAAGARTPLHLRSASSQALHLRGGQDCNARRILFRCVGYKDSEEAEVAKAKVVDTNGSLSLVNRALIKT
jgi:hypothetical protein